MKWSCCLNNVILIIVKHTNPFRMTLNLFFFYSLIKKKQFLCLRVAMVLMAMFVLLPVVPIWICTIHFNITFGNFPGNFLYTCSVVRLILLEIMVIFKIDARICPWLCLCVYVYVCFIEKNKRFWWRSAVEPIVIRIRFGNSNVFCLQCFFCLVCFQFRWPGHFIYYRIQIQTRFDLIINNQFHWNLKCRFIIVLAGTRCLCQLNSYEVFISISRIILKYNKYNFNALV